MKRNNAINVFNIAIFVAFAVMMFATPPPAFAPTLMTAQTNQAMVYLLDTPAAGQETSKFVKTVFLCSGNTMRQEVASPAGSWTRAAAHVPHQF